MQRHLPTAKVAQQQAISSDAHGLVRWPQGMDTLVFLSMSYGTFVHSPARYFHRQGSGVVFARLCMCVYVGHCSITVF